MGLCVDEPAADFLASCAATLRPVLHGALNLRQSRARERSRGSERVGRPGEVLVDEPPSLLRRAPRIARWDRFVIQRTARRWRRLAGPPDAGPLIAYVFHPKFWPYIEYLDADYLVYHAYDLFERNRGWSKKLDAFQRLLIQRADLAFSSSEAIADALESKYGRAPTVIANGADYEAFVGAADALGPEPTDLVCDPKTAHRLYRRSQSEGGFRVDRDARAPKAPVAVRAHWRGSQPRRPLPCGAGGGPTRAERPRSPTQAARDGAALRLLHGCEHHVLPVG